VVILAAAGDQRFELRSDLPTIAESGVPGFGQHLVRTIWTGEDAGGAGGQNPGGVEAVLSADRPVEHLKSNSCTRMNATPLQFYDFIVGDAKHWQGVIQAVGLKPE
jgi:tripartite-type tricarboxylate transporter receptor subunit TctC